MSLLSVRALSVAARFARERAPVLDGVDLEIDAGEVVALIGESGCGKTTLARAIAGLLPPGLSVTGGTIFFDGGMLDGARQEAERGAGIFYCPTGAAACLNPALRLGIQLDEVALPGESLNWLLRLGFSDPQRIRSAYPFELSGGEAQRVLLAMGLARRPRLLILDEPSAGLDEAAQAGLVSILADLPAAGRCPAVLLISHRLRLVRGVARSLFIMAGGRIVEGGAASAVLAAPRHPQTRDLLRAAGMAG